MKRPFSDAISSTLFLPIALRRSSASAGEKPASDFAICMLCSWYTVTPYVRERVSLSRSSR